MGRYDYVKYCDRAIELQATFKRIVEELEMLIKAVPSSNGEVARYKALALTASEEMYCWIGKLIRDDQIARNGSAELQEERNNE